MESKYNPESAKNERAVSPVIGVILMVAITVILAAVIAAFVLDLGSGTSANPSAGFNFDEDAGTEVVVTINNVDRLDSAYVTVEGEDDSKPFPSTNPGETVTMTIGSSSTDGQYAAGDTIQIIGEYEGQESVITTYQTSN